MAHKIENTVAAVGGVVLGGLVMYLLDPELGTKRRAAVTSTASGAVHSTQESIRDAVNAAVDTVHNAYDSAADTVHDTLHGARKTAEKQSGRVSRYAGVAKKLAGKVAGRVGSAATDLSSTLSDHAAAVADHASHLSDRLSELIGHASDSASDTVSAAAKTVAAAKAAGSNYADRLRAEIYRNLSTATDSANRVGDTARKNAQQVLKSAQSKADQATGHESHPVATTVGLTTGGLALLGAGAAAMYYLDPVRGRARRAQSADQLFAIGRRTGKRARKFGRHVGNQLQGYAAETRGAVRDWESSVTGESDSVEATPSMPIARPTV